MGFEKTPYFQWYDSGWRAAVSFNSVWSGDENRIYSRMEQVAAGELGRRLCQASVKCADTWSVSGFYYCVLFPLYLFRMIGAGDIKMAAVLFGAAGVQQGGRILLCG